MKPSSTDRTAPLRATHPVVSDHAVAPSRPAMLDRQLTRGGLEARYADPKLTELVREATRTARDGAHAEGYAAGWAQGRGAADREARAERDQLRLSVEADRKQWQQRASALLDELRHATQALESQRMPLWDEVADVLVDGALALARAALARELSAVDSVTAEAMRCAVRTFSDNDDVVLHVNPRDLDVMTEAPGLTLVPDLQVPQGTVTARTPTQHLRVDLPAAIAAAEEVLRT